MMSLFGMFGNKTDENLRLIDLVDKNENHELGLFANVQNDLGKYTEKVGNGEDKLRLMAYGYARRISAAGLYLQGAWKRDDYNHASMMFKNLQITTGHTKEFQIAANEQAVELLESYDNRMSNELVGVMVSIVENGSTPSPDDVFNVDFVINNLKSVL